MVKNKLEKLFNKSRPEQFAWSIKLHNNMLTHQTTPADYMCSIINKFMLIECKQVTLKEGKGRLAFKRLKQMHDLLAFEHIHGNKSAFFCIAYKDSFWRDSEVYLVPIKIMKQVTDMHTMVSLNRSDASFYFKDYKVPIEQGILQMGELL